MARNRNIMRRYQLPGSVYYSGILILGGVLEQEYTRYTISVLLCFRKLHHDGAADQNVTFVW